MELIERAIKRHEDAADKPAATTDQKTESDRAADENLFQAAMDRAEAEEAPVEPAPSSGAELGPTDPVAASNAVSGVDPDPAPADTAPVASDLDVSSPDDTAGTDPHVPFETVAAETMAAAEPEIQDVGDNSAPAPAPATHASAPVAESKNESKPRSRPFRLDPEVLERHRIIGHNKLNLQTMHYDRMRTYVFQRMEENGWTKLGIVSAAANNGKSVTAVNLAMAAARLPDTNVLLADFDLKRPSLAQYLGLPGGVGVSDVLAQKAPLSSALVSLDLKGLTVLPNFESIDHSAEMLSGQKAHQLAEELGSRYRDRKIIFDLPPILSSDDTSAFLPALDCVLFVASNGQTTSGEVNECNRKLAQTPIVAAVLNKFNAISKPY